MAGDDYGVFAAGRPGTRVQVATPSGRQIQVTFRHVSVGDLMEASDPGDDGADPPELVQSVRLLAASIVSWDLPQPPSPQVIAQMELPFFAVLSAACQRAVGGPLAVPQGPATANGSSPSPAPSPPAPPSASEPSPPSPPTSTGDTSASFPVEGESGISQPV